MSPASKSLITIFKMRDENALVRLGLANVPAHPSRLATPRLEKLSHLMLSSSVKRLAGGAGALTHRPWPKGAAP